jgi:hypothetical protein
VESRNARAGPRNSEVHKLDEATKRHKKHKNEFWIPPES